MPLRLILALTLLSACVTFPEVDAALSTLPATTTAPPLLPADELAARVAASPDAYSAGIATAARAAALRARAAALRAR